MSTTIGKHTEGKKMCPTCHQLINSRVLRLRKAHVSALIKSVKYMAKNKTKTFNIRDIADEFTNTEYACFNDTKRLLPGIVSGQAGQYTFNNTALMDFLTGGEVVVGILVTPGTDRFAPMQYGTIADVKGSGAFIENNKWITTYKRPELELNQLAIV